MFDKEKEHYKNKLLELEEKEQSRIKLFKLVKDLPVKELKVLARIMANLKLFQ